MKKHGGTSGKRGPQGACGSRTGSPECHRPEVAREHNVQAIIRGLRAVTDFEYELAMSQTNRVAAPDIDTIFLNTSLKYAYLSSSIVKEMAMYGGDISKFVPESIIDIVRERYSSSYNIKANEKGDIK